MFVAVEADTMAQSMGEEFVVGAVAGAGDYGASGGVHGAGELACARGIKRRILRVAHNFENRRDSFRRLAKYTGAGHVGLIAFHGAAAVDQHHIAGLERARLQCAVRQRCRHADQRQSIAAQTHFRETRLHQIAQILLRKPFF